MGVIRYMSKNSHTTMIATTQCFLTQKELGLMVNVTKHNFTALKTQTKQRQRQK